MADYRENADLHTDRVVDFGDKDYAEDEPPKLCADCPGTDDPGCCQGDAADALGQAMEP